MKKKSGSNRKVKHHAKSKPVTRNQSISLANSQIHQREFVADYTQVVLRISSAATQGLRFGAPPPKVN